MIKRNDFLDRVTRDFIVNEGVRPSETIYTYIQSLNETLNNMVPRTKTESRRLAIAKEHVREIKRKARKMTEQLTVLQEKLSVLEESQKENE